ncbi:hypothetical protein [Thermomonospora umbrina]|uniref:hypothetical protein n=1 Tax=Thermomonospora umbrina TaxID=111806 RepID=UPI0011C0EFF8|nr:hypothetical protein [Thermomonospora umbrina]
MAGVYLAAVNVAVPRLRLINGNGHLTLLALSAVPFLLLAVVPPGGALLARTAVALAPVLAGDVAAMAKARLIVGLCVYGPAMPCAAAVSVLLVLALRARTSTVSERVR